jgi:hypothetical protein
MVSLVLREEYRLTVFRNKIQRRVHPDLKHIKKHEAKNYVMTGVACILHQILSSNPIKEYKFGEPCAMNGEVHTIFSRKSEGMKRIDIHWGRAVKYCHVSGVCVTNNNGL